MARQSPKPSAVPHRLIRSGAFLLFAFALVVIFLLRQPQDNKEIGEGKATQTAEKVENKKSFGQRFSSDPINILTSGLLMLGIAQAGLFFWQLRLIRESLADTKKAAKAAKRQARLARLALEVDERAWLNIEVQARLPIRDDMGGIQIDFRYVFHNFGKTPALRARIEIEIINPMISMPVIAQSKLSARLISDNTSFGDMVFPSETILQNWTWSAAGDVREKWSEEINAAGFLEMGAFHAIAVGAVRYETIFGDIKQTGFIRDLGFLVYRENVSLLPSVNTSADSEGFVRLKPWIRDGEVT